MLLVIQCQAASHFRKATDATTIYPKLIEWFGLDYKGRIGMLILDHYITAFACLSDGYLTVVEGVNISRDLLESRHKVVSGCAGEPYYFNVFSVLVKEFSAGFFFVAYFRGVG